MMYTNQENLLEQAGPCLLQIHIPWKGLRVLEPKNIPHIRYIIGQNAWLKSQKEHFRQNRSKLYRIERQNGDQFTEKSIQLIYKQAHSNACIIKSANLHWLIRNIVYTKIRRATHLLELGTILCDIQELFAHNSCSTTEIYPSV